MFAVGSLAAASGEFVIKSRERGWPVLLMPEKLLHNERVNFYKLIWARRIIAALRRHPKVIMAIGTPIIPGKRASFRLPGILSDTAAIVQSVARPGCICVEGGATGAMLVQRMRWTRLTVEQEFQTGVTGARPCRSCSSSA